MDDAAYMEHLREHSLGLVAAAERAGSTATVPSCPDWSVADLVWHLTEVQHFWTWVVAERATDPANYPEPERPADEELAERCRHGVDTIVATLQAADRNDVVWSWAPGVTDVAWVVRRQAHEAAVHRWDAERAAGTDFTVPPDLAVDGIDEFFELMAPFPKKDAPSIGGTVHLHCTDADGEWLVREPEPGAPLEVTKEHAKGDVAVRGPASDLLLLLWCRVDLDTDGDRFEVFGDTAVAQRLVARSNLS